MKRAKEARSFFICGKHDGDWFRIVCGICRGEPETNNQYVGADPPEPRIRFTCEKCGGSAELKLQRKRWRGLPVVPFKE